MFHKPQLTHIDRLDQVGNELNLLKRHYKSYIRIIDRITELSSGTESNTLSSSQVTARMIEDDEGHLIMPAAQTGGTALIGVDPGPAAYVRFERLKDMIMLYALSEVKDYLEKKQTLVDMVRLQSLPTCTYCTDIFNPELSIDCDSRIKRRRAIDTCLVTHHQSNHSISTCQSHDCLLWFQHFQRELHGGAVLDRIHRCPCTVIRCTDCIWRDLGNDGQLRIAAAYTTLLD